MADREQPPRDPTGSPGPAGAGPEFVAGAGADPTRPPAGDAGPATAGTADTSPADPTVPPEEPRFSWRGGPGYTPLPDILPPHAPLPGAPPYPAQPEHPPAPVGEPPARTGYGRALGATAVWAAVNLLLVLLVMGPPPSTEAAAVFAGRLAVSTLAGALITWLIARRRGWPFWLLVLVAAPLFWVLRAVMNVV